MTETDPDALYLAEWERERDGLADPDDAGADPGDAFWTARKVHEHILAVARGEMAGPWATLGIALARVVAQVPPFVVLPKAGSLNLFVGLVGLSGGGKGQAARAGAMALDLIDEHFATAGVGSGEGIAHLYMRRTGHGTNRTVEQHTQSVIFDVPEVDTLAALGGRGGATLMPELRKAWFSEPLGFGYADPDKRLPVHPHTYRMCMTIGIQPKRAGYLLEDHDGGTPQRILWLPVGDPYAPDEEPATPTPWTWRLPDLPMADISGRVEIPVCRLATREIKAHRRRILRDQAAKPGEDTLDTHALFGQLKIAAALGLLDGHVEVTEEDWNLAAMVRAESDRQRSAVRLALAKAAEARNRAQGVAEAERLVIAGEKVAGAAQKRIARSVLRHLAAAGVVGLASSELRRRIAMRDRGDLDPVLAWLVGDGDVIAESSDQGQLFKIKQRF